MHRLLFVIIALVVYPLLSHSQKADTLGLGWSKTSVNTVIFRKNSLTSDGSIQYASWYDSSGMVTLAMKAKGKWTTHTTAFKGNVADAHNSISIMVDGDGYLHMAWDHHGHPLHYTRSKNPRSLEMHDVMAMIGTVEQSVTYPEFHRLANGDLLFLYRDGQSGRGNLVMNRYDLKSKKWVRLHSNLIDGESQRNAYWQAFADAQGTIHISWVWREAPDVAANRDLGYARSKDGGLTWQRTDGTSYSLPITASNAEYAMRIPMNSELINQTSMTATNDGKPLIASYWRDTPNAVPQYFIVYHNGTSWNKVQVTQRTTDFSLKGGGTKRIPISRPQVMISGKAKNEKLLLVYRDVEHDNNVTIAKCDHFFSAPANTWTFQDATTTGVGQWEPSYDTELWRSKSELVLFVQRSGQGDGEKMEDLPPQPVVVLHVDF